MPNWCSNEVTITAESVVIDGVVDSINNKNGRFFDYLRPMPTYLSERTAGGGTGKMPSSWYDWRSDNWGCKWDACETHIVEVSDKGDDTKSVTILFESPWAPPINLYNFLYSIDVDVKATYSEPMMGFKGSYSNGVDTEVDTLAEEDA